MVLDEQDRAGEEGDEDKDGVENDKLQTRTDCFRESFAASSWDIRFRGPSFGGCGCLPLEMAKASLISTTTAEELVLHL